MTGAAPRKRLHVTNHAITRLRDRYPDSAPVDRAAAIRLLCALYHRGHEIGERVCDSAFVILSRWELKNGGDTMIALSCHVEADETVNVVTVLLPSELHTTGFIRLPATP